MSDPTTSTIVTATHKIGGAVSLGGFGISAAHVTDLMQLVAATTGAIIGVLTLIDMFFKWRDKRTKRRSAL